MTLYFVAEEHGNWEAMNFSRGIHGGADSDQLMMMMMVMMMMMMMITMKMKMMVKMMITMKMKMMVKIKMTTTTMMVMKMMTTTTTTTMMNMTMTSMMMMTHVFPGIKWQRINVTLRHRILTIISLLCSITLHNAVKIFKRKLFLKLFAFLKKKREVIYNLNIFSNGQI